MDVVGLQEPGKSALRGWLREENAASSRRDGFRGLGPGGRLPTTRPRGDTFTYHQGSCRGVVWLERGNLFDTLWMLCIDDSHDPAYEYGARLLAADQLYPDAADFRERDEAAVRHELADSIGKTAAVAIVNPGVPVESSAAGYWVQLTSDPPGIWVARVKLSRGDILRDEFETFGPEDAHRLLLDHLKGEPAPGDLEYADFDDYRSVGFAFIGDVLSGKEWLDKQIALAVE